jgi:lysophospholipase L1-like esterase
LPTWRRALLGLLALLTLAAPLRAAAPALRVLCLGDAHAAVDAGQDQALAEALGRPVRYAAHAGNAARLQDLGPGLRGHGPWALTLRWARAWHPDLLLLAYGTNEATRPHPERQLPARWSAILRALQERLPDTRLVLLGPPATARAATPSLDTNRRFQAQAAQAAGVRWLDRAELLEPGERALAPDGAHLTPTAYRRLATRVALALARDLDAGPGRDPDAPELLEPSTPAEPPAALDPTPPDRSRELP